MPTPATPAELREILAPFVGVRLTHKRDPKTGYVLPREQVVDILCDSNKVDADIRSVTGEGIEVFFYSGCEFVPWSAVRQVTVRAIDARGFTLASTVYRVVEPVSAAA